MSGITRRTFLANGTTVAAGLAIPSATALAQTPLTDTKRTRIDVHHHVLPKRWIDEARAHKPDNTWPPAVVNWTPQTSIAEMDRYGVETAITSLGLPGVWWAAPPDARRIARYCNEYNAQMLHDYPGRFGMLATVPLPDVEGTLMEIAYALDVLHADGIGLLTSYGDRWPGDPAFAAVFDELNRRKAVVHFHPTVPNCCTTLIPGVSAATEEYLFDTSRAITSLLFNGTFTRCPDINYIFSHAGGAFPPLAHRIVSEIIRNKTLLARYPNGPDEELSKLYFDTATSVSAPTFQAVRNLTSTEHLLLGTDLPYLPMSETIPGLDALGLSPSDARAINTGNALRLFPRLRRFVS
jgi:predicted TIM-barrel fold metal-dependent hydrolase